MGRIATGQLVDLIGITTEKRVLDAGSGIGDTAVSSRTSAGATSPPST